MTQAQPAAAPPPDDGWWAASSMAYHADRTAESSSTLKAFRASIPAYYGMYVAGTIPRPEPSDSQDVGTALHVRLLEPDKFGELVVTLPAGTERRSNAGKAAYAKFVADQAPGAVILKPEQKSAVEKMFESVMANPAARALMEAEGRNEAAYRWTDGPTGIKLKVMHDRILWTGLIVDVKTAADPTPAGWPRAAAGFGYHRQAALYIAGARHASGWDSGLAPWEPEQVEHRNVVVGNDEPYDCIVYKLRAADLAAGEAQNRETLTRLADCRAFGAWHGRWHGLVVDAELPPWSSW